MIINDNLQWINFYKDVHYQNLSQEMLKNLRKYIYFTVFISFKTIQERLCQINGLKSHFKKLEK